MTESRDEAADTRGDKEQNPGGTEPGGEEGAYPGGDEGAGPDVAPGLGGFEDRDPKTDMPRIPSVPETQEDPKTHGGAPDPDKEEQTGSDD